MSRTTFNRLAVLVFASAILCSHCGKEECVEPTNGGTESPSFANDIQPIFSANCAVSGCHNAATASENLNVSEGHAFGQLVDINASQENGIKRVAPGDAENSYLIIKLEDRQTIGAAMPLGGSLSSDEVQLIRNWIESGAEDK